MVIYDDLIDRDLLREVPSHAQVIYMGKRQGKHAARQEETCAQPVRCAQEGKRVVRLKGGDPFVFGRGGEELLALEQAGIPCEVVPGINSALAIPDMAGIPVTHRRLSRGVYIVTAHTADTGDGLPECLDDLPISIAAPPEGITVGLSGSEPMTEKLREALEPLGARTFLAQQSILQPLPLPIPLSSLCDGKPHWLVFTSANGVKVFFRQLRTEQADLRRLHQCRFAVIGAAGILKQSAEKAGS